MSSTARNLANRANAMHSTGPRTEAGKAASAANSIKHGLTGKQIVLPGEDPDAYDLLRTSLHREFAPKTEAERILVEEIAANSWRLSRAHRVETAFLRKLTENSADPDMAIAMAMIEKPAELNRLQRYVTSIERAYYKGMSELARLQKLRSANDRKQAMIRAYLEQQTENSGFVSQHDERRIPAVAMRLARAPHNTGAEPESQLPLAA